MPISNHTGKCIYLGIVKKKLRNAKDAVVYKDFKVTSDNPLQGLIDYIW